MNVFDISDISAVPESMREKVKTETATIERGPSLADRVESLLLESRTPVTPLQVEDAMVRRGIISGPYTNPSNRGRTYQILHRLRQDGILVKVDDGYIHYHNLARYNKNARRRERRAVERQTKALEQSRVSRNYARAVEVVARANGAVR